MTCPRELALLLALPTCAVVLVRRCFAQPPLGWGEIAVWLARGAGRGVFDAWGDLAGPVIVFPLAGGLSWIELLAVHPRARRGGVGRRLAAAVGPAMLAVREGNGEAQAFYARGVRGGDALARLLRRRRGRARAAAGVAAVSLIALCRV